MQGYEIVTIVDPQIADEDVPKTSDKINEFITSRGGAVARVQRWGGVGWRTPSRGRQRPTTC